MSETAPAKIRVAQDAEGFWTCREAISGSQQYVREDIVSDLLSSFERIVEAKGMRPGHVAYLSRADIEAIAAAALTKAGG